MSSRTRSTRCRAASRAQPLRSRHRPPRSPGRVSATCMTRRICGVIVKRCTGRRSRGEPPRGSDSVRRSHVGQLESEALRCASRYPVNDRELDSGSGHAPSNRRAESLDHPRLSCCGMVEPSRRRRSSRSTRFGDARAWRSDARAAGVLSACRASRRSASRHPLIGVEGEVPGTCVVTDGHRGAARISGPL